MARTSVQPRPLSRRTRRSGALAATLATALATVLAAVLAAGTVPANADPVPELDRSVASVKVRDVQVLPSSIEVTLGATADGQGWVPTSR